MTSGDVHRKQFTSTEHQFGYDKRQVAAFLEAAGIRLAAMESKDRPPEPLVSGTILTDGPSGPTQQDFDHRHGPSGPVGRVGLVGLVAEWAEWADSTRFSTTRKRWGYDTAEVDAFQQEIRDTFLGVRQPPLTSDEAHIQNHLEEHHAGNQKDQLRRRHVCPERCRTMPACSFDAVDLPVALDVWSWGW